MSAVLARVDDRALESGDTPVEQASYACDAAHCSAQRGRVVHADEVPAVLTATDLRALLPFGRSKFQALKAAGAFAAFELPSLAGTVVYSGVKVRAWLRSDAHGSARRFFGATKKRRG